VIPFLSDDEILLVRQYRHPVRSDLWEIPAGKLEAGEDPLACARRELREETGYDAEDWSTIGTFYTSPGFCDERIALYIASGLRSVASPIGDEIAEQKGFRIEELERMIDASALPDMKTTLAIAWLLARARRPR